MIYIFKICDYVFLLLLCNLQGLVTLTDVVLLLLHQIHPLLKTPPAPLLTNYPRFDVLLPFDLLILSQINYATNVLILLHHVLPFCSSDNPPPPPDKSWTK